MLLGACAEAVNNDGDIPRSRRSGRLLLPRLAFWANQRLVSAPKLRSNAQLMQGTDVLISSATHLQFTEVQVMSVTDQQSQQCLLQLQLQ